MDIDKTRILHDCFGHEGADGVLDQLFMKSRGVLPMSVLKRRLK